MWGSKARARRGSTRTRIVVGTLLVMTAVATAACASSGEPAAPPPIIPAGEYDPAVWGEVYPAQYERWLATSDKRPAGMSAYKRGFDDGVMFDKLSQYPFMAVLFNGWGFGIDYNEPRGHYYMLIDQHEADPARVKAGGACLTCKSPYAEDLYEQDSKKLFGATYADAVAMLPPEHRQLGATCIDCHDNATLELRTRRWTLDSALKEIGLEKDRLSLHQKRLLSCGQCHCTYSVMKDGTTVLDVDFPWEGSTWGGITAEKIIAALESQEKRHEWVQTTTGFKLGYIRHPDVEFFTTGSPHFQAGASCSDCHMPEVRVGSEDIADHNFMSPLKQPSMPCKGCHTATDAEMRVKVRAIQDRNLALLIKAGYETATVAKLFEIANRSLETTSGDAAYDQAANDYRQAFYRVVYMGAENSVGFHNPDEGVRILNDASASAGKADAGLRGLLASKGVKVPAEVDLQLRSYLDDRGVKKLDYNAAQNLPDPSGYAPKTWPKNLKTLE